VKPAVKSEKRPVASAHPRIVRRLGHFEKYQEALYFHDQYCGTSVAVRYVLPKELVAMEKHAEVQGQLTRAVAQTVLDHPLLQVGVTKPGVKPAGFTKIDEIDFDNHIEWHTVSPDLDYAKFSEDVLNEQLDRRFTHVETRPGWRISVLRPEGAAFLDVIYIWKHTMHDGTGAKIFHRDLFKHLNNPPVEYYPLGLSGSILNLREKQFRYPLPLDKAVKFPISPGYTLTTAWKELKPAAFAKPTHTQKLWGPFKKGRGVTARRTVRMDAERSKKIVAVCREHGTTLTGLINGIAFVSLLHETADSGGPPSFEACSAMDMRRFIPEKAPGTSIDNDAKNCVSNMVTLADHHWDEEQVAQLAKLVKEPVEGMGQAHMEDVLWNVAQSTRRDIETKLTTGTKNDIMGMMKFVPDWNKEKEKLFKKPRRESWLVTNLGVMDLPETKPEESANAWGSDRAWFSLSAETAKPLFSYAAVGLKGGEICIDIIWQEYLNEYVDRIANTLEGHMYRWLNFVATGTWSDEGMLPAFEA